MTTIDDESKPAEEAGAPTTSVDGRSLVRGRWLPGWQRLVAGLLAGALLAGSMPPREAWYLAPAGAVVLAWSVLSLTWRQRLALGAATGLAFFLPTLSWLTGFHPAGFGALFVVEVVLFAAAMLLVDPRRARWWTVPLALIALEAVRARFPFAAAAPPGGSLLVVGLSTGAGAAVTGVAVAGRRVRTLISIAVLVAVSAVCSTGIRASRNSGSTRAATRSSDDAA